LPGPFFPKGKRQTRRRGGKKREAGYVPTWLSTFPQRRNERKKEKRKDKGENALSQQPQLILMKKERKKK